jgi:hypothetical protein
MGESSADKTRRSSLQHAQSVGKKALSPLFVDVRRRQRDRGTEDFSSVGQAQLTQGEF